MSHFQRDYEALVTRLCSAYPSEQAMSLAVGGDFEHMGDVEYAILKQYGLKPGMFLVDVGCGSGRLAQGLLRNHWQGWYFGTDVVRALVDYAKAGVDKSAIPHNIVWRFRVTDGLSITRPDEDRANMVCFFSVLTHLLPEESYVYLEHAHAALREGGRVVLSYLSYPDHWEIFSQSIDRTRRRATGDHLNTFLHPETLSLWASKIGFRLVSLDRLSHPELGQALCVLEK